MWPADNGVAGMEDRSRVADGLGCLEQAFDREQVALAQHGVEQGDSRVGA